MTRRAALITALAIGAGAVLIPAGVASAHDFVPTATTAACEVQNGVLQKSITVTVTNQFDMPAVFTSSRLSGSELPLAPNGSNHYLLRTAGTTTGTQKETVMVTWTDGTKVTHDVSLRWGDTPCVPPTTQPPTTFATTIPATTEPPTTAPETPTVPPTTVPATTPTTTCAHPVTLEDGSVVCNDTYHAPPATPPTNPPAEGHGTTIGQLPTTGGISATAIGLGVFLILCGLIICLWARSENRRLRKMNEDVMSRAEER